MKKSSRAVVNLSDIPSAGAVQPIDPSTAFAHIDGETQAYPRYFNTPNQDAVAAKIAALESADAGLIFGSGMAAISTTMTALLQPGDHAVFLKGLYGGSQAFILNELEDRQVSFTFASKEIDSFAAALQDNTRLIYLESPTNPTLDIVDLRAIAKLARERDVLTVIDNTFASPINQNPIELGIDVVIHSGTKYLGGHSDLCSGAVVAADDLIRQIHKKAKLYGGSLNAISVYLLDRSLKTLDVRVQRQTQQAAKIAEFLQEQPSVVRVLYPGLKAHPDHEIAQGQMHGFGAMIAFELAASVSVTQFLKNLRLVRAALSLGGVESSVCVPATTSHRDVPAETLEELGMTPQVVRLSVGIEDLADITSDLEQAIRLATASVAAN
jgi:cystathionine beta-lyase